MLTVLIIVVAILAVVFLELAGYIVYAKKAPLERKLSLEYLLYRRTGAYTPETAENSYGATPRYSEHPFTGWSLNSEFKNIYGDKIHDRHGFRYDKEIEERDPNTLRVYCAGGSSTYCVFIERNEETWPDVLGRTLAEKTGKNVEVINGGVGSFNTYQSFIRLSAYVDYLQPDIVVVYHAKNDLNPYYSGDPDNGRSLPDFSNLLRSLSFSGMSAPIHPLARWSSIAKLWSIWKLPVESMNLSYVYERKKRPDIPNLLAARTDFSIIETMQRNMVGLCRGRGINLVYMTQRVEDPVFTRYIQEINDRVKKLDNHENGCFVYDLDGQLPYDSDLLFDKIHFTPKGCVEVANGLADFIVTSKLA